MAASLLAMGLYSLTHSLTLVACLVYSQAPITQLSHTSKSQTKDIHEHKHHVVCFLIMFADAPAFVLFPHVGPMAVLGSWNFWNIWLVSRGVNGCQAHLMSSTGPWMNNVCQWVSTGTNGYQRSPMDIKTGQRSSTGSNAIEWVSMCIDGYLWVSTGRSVFEYQA